MAKISKKASARVKPRKKHPRRSKNSWMVTGFDLSMSSIAGAAYAYDATLDKFLGPKFTMKSWGPNTHYFERIKDCSRAEDFIHDLMGQMKLVVGLNETYIATEEPFPTGMVKRLESKALKQQAEISGAFLAGLLRYGFQNIYQISWYQWAQIIAADLGVTIHYSKWNYKENPFELAPSGKGSGKWRPKEWALKNGVPDWPDLITREKTGKIPRPEGSRARAVQPDDRYDALAVCEWMREEYLAGLA